jgi:hypothetical protein
MTIQRIQWTCPVCKRRYAIPATAPTPSRCPTCRQAETAQAAEEAASDGPSFPVMATAVADVDDEEHKLETAALSALAAIQLEVAEEAARGPTAAAPVMRRNESTSGVLPILAIVFTVLSGLAVVGAFVGLLVGLHAAFSSPANAARTVTIFEAIGVFGGGLVSALMFFTFRELIHILLDIEENTRPQ